MFSRVLNSFGLKLHLGIEGPNHHFRILQVGWNMFICLFENLQHWSLFPPLLDNHRKSSLVYSHFLFGNQ